LTSKYSVKLFNSIDGGEEEKGGGGTYWGKVFRETNGAEKILRGGLGRRFY